MMPTAIGQTDKRRRDATLSPFEDALLQWQFEDLKGRTRNGQVSVEPVGNLDLTLGSAVFKNGSLVTQEGLDAIVAAEAEQFSFAVRLTLPKDIGECTILSAGTDATDRLLRLSVGDGVSPLNVIVEWGTELELYFLQVPFNLLQDHDAHDIVVRYTGNRLDLYVDGQLLHHHGTASGRLRRPAGPLVIGGEWQDGKAIHRFSGKIVHAVFWDRSITDEEIVWLSGGSETVLQRAKDIAQRQAEMEDALAARAARDPQRPAFHFLPRALWMNDPNGMFYWKGEFHLFYQHNPNGPYWGTMHWGHAVSEDLVFWRHLPIALAPSPDGPDRDGCFSGCTIEHDGRPALLYTGVYPECQCLVYADECLREFKKADQNPVVPAPPKGIAACGFRDPWVWKEDDGHYYMIVGSGVEDQGGFLPLYRSQDLLEWEYLHSLLTGSEGLSHTVWECPSFFPLGDRWVLLISHEPYGNVQYFVGRYEDHHFFPETHGEIDAKGSFYAPHVQLDGKGRRVMMAWSPEARSDRSQWKAGWASVQTLPRVLTLGDDGELQIEPIPELRVLRGDEWSCDDLSVPDGGANLLPEVKGDMLEIEAEIDLRDVREVGFRLRQSPDREEETIIFFDQGEKALIVNQERSSRNPETDRNNKKVPVVLKDGETLRLRIFVDRSIMEIYANYRACLTTRVYPERDDSVGVDMYAAGGTAVVKALRVWKMKSIWTNIS
ncbi:GH32 C-terminal domain-containing protein [bacterium]|nr:GH32 C-terminal domain-containing protein [bacterium]